MIDTLKITLAWPLTIAFQVALCSSPLLADWPMLAHDAAQSGATATQLDGPFPKMVPGLCGRRDHGRRAAGHRRRHVYVGTLRGIVHAIDAERGNEVLDAKTRRRHSPQLRRLRRPSLLRRRRRKPLRGQDAKSGDNLWLLPTGSQSGTPRRSTTERPRRQPRRAFSTRRRRDWAGQLEERNRRPPLSSPAIDAKAGRVYIGSEDMHVYALRPGRPAPAWKSDKLPGVSFRGYHPVIAPDGSVMITVMPAAGGDAIQQVLLDMVKEVFGDFASWRHKKDENDRLRKQNFELLEDPQTYAKRNRYLRKRLDRRAGAIRRFSSSTGRPANRSSSPRSSTPRA